MQIGLIGLGKMGFNLALNFRRNGHDVTAFDISKSAMERIRTEGITTAASVGELADSLSGRKVIWIMVPAGNGVDVILGNLKNHLKADDIIIDGGNSYYKDSITRAADLDHSGIHLLDCGTSGSVSGALNGISATVGGFKGAFDHCAELFNSIAQQDGVMYCGKSGNGHFVKMIHCGIEYGMMQAIAEGIELVNKFNPSLDMASIIKTWNNGSVIKSDLLQLTQKIFEQEGDLQSIKGVMNSSGEGKWTVETALELGVPAPVITMALLTRYRSQQKDTLSGKVVAALRNQFGGHAVEPDPGKNQ
ncbi:MAG: phosphogluconate dehydrogenase (NAD(+)-dependent, decarboxylating) [Bacteroidota bacterium]